MKPSSAERYAAVFGAFVAAQAQDKMSSGRGAPTQGDVLVYVEEAETLADMAEEAYGVLHTAAKPTAVEVVACGVLKEPPVATPEPCFNKLSWRHFTESDWYGAEPFNADPERLMAEISVDGHDGIAILDAETICVQWDASREAHVEAYIQPSKDGALQYARAAVYLKPETTTEELRALGFEIQGEGA